MSAGAGPLSGGGAKSAAASWSDATVVHPPFCVVKRCHTERRSSMCGGSAASTADASACSAAHSAGVEGVAPPPVGQTETSWPTSTVSSRPLPSASCSAAAVAPRPA